MPIIVFLIALCGEDTWGVVGVGRGGVDVLGADGRGVEGACGARGCGAD
ncbi:MAG: hypothetical protein KC609_01175 [Myxococcales bacterium]|nr:hypothetical protein [Myxococcales bacterium]